MQTPAFAATKTPRTWRLFRGMIWVAAVMAACLCPTLAFGQTNSSWNGGTGNWSNATDWNPNQVPNNGGGNTYNVTIDSLTSTDFTLLNINATVDSLVVGGTTGALTSTLEIGVVQSLDVTGALTVNPTGSLNMSSFNSLTVGGTFTNSGTVDLATGTGNTASVGALTNNSFLIIGGTLNLTNQPNGITDIVAGSIWVVDGTINAGSNNGLANLSSIEGVLNLGNGQTTTVTPSSGTLMVNSSSIGHSDLVLQSGTTLVVNGSLTNSSRVSVGESELAVTDTFTNNGVLELGSSGTISPSHTTTANLGSLINNGSVTIDLAGLTSVVANVGTVTNMGTITIGSGTSLNLTNSGGSFVQTSGQTVVNGTLNSVPAVQIQGGTLSGSGTINANVIMGGTISPGNSPGILTINGNYTQTAFGAYVAELAGLTAGTGYDQLDVSGTANLDGTLDVSLINGFTVALGDSFILMKYDSETGTFSMVDLPKLGNGLKWDLSYDPGFIDLSVTSGVTTTPEPSAYLLWGTVGLLGIGIWARRRFGRGLGSSV